MPPVLRLVAATTDMKELLTRALAEHGIACRSQGHTVVVEGAVEGTDGSTAAPERVLSLLREILSGPEREAVSVLEDLDYPHEFPVATRLEAWWQVFETSWFERAIAADAFSIWFQPIVDTTARRTIGHECLIRLTKGHRREGAEIMAAAAARRDLRGFDSLTRQLAIRSVASQRQATRRATGMCFVNFLPSTIYRPACCLRPVLELIQETGVRAGSIVMEAVGATHNPDIDHLRRIGDYLREQGLGFALDDVGVNAEALRMICELKPDYIKLDKKVIQKIDQPREAAAVGKLVEIAERLRVRVVAKGVERVSTMEHLWMAGIQCMQGYLFGSPAPDIAVTGMDLVRLARAIEPAAQPDGVGLVTLGA